MNNINVNTKVAKSSVETEGGKGGASSLKVDEHFLTLGSLFNVSSLVDTDAETSKILIKREGSDIWEQEDLSAIIPSGGGGLDVNAMWQELGKNDVSKKIHISHIPDIPVEKITGTIPGGETKFNEAFILYYNEDGTLKEIEAKAGLFAPYLSSVNADIVPSGGGGSYVLPIASSTVLGGVKIGTGLTIDSKGVLSVTGGSSSGLVWNDLTLEGSQQIHPTHLSTALSGYATETWVNNKGYLTNSQVNDKISLALTNYVMDTDIATTSELGIVKIGIYSGLSVSSYGTLSINIGEGLEITAGNKLQVTAVGLTWNDLSAATGEQINKSHLSNALSNYYHTGNANLSSIAWQGSTLTARDSVVTPEINFGNGYKIVKTATGLKVEGGGLEADYLSADNGDIVPISGGSGSSVVWTGDVSVPPSQYESGFIEIDSFPTGNGVYMLEGIIDCDDAHFIRIPFPQGILTILDTFRFIYWTQDTTNEKIELTVKKQSNGFVVQNKVGVYYVYIDRVVFENYS